jgi:TRAP-type C4-dicarboxylate transport system substrate-binding protein
MDGPLGDFLARTMEERINYRVLGWFENGFRHISNNKHEIRKPADFGGMSIRVLPSDVQARTFALLGATPLRLDLTEAIAGITGGTIDAQENPLANTVTYGVHKFHRFHTLTGHFYISRPIFLNRTEFDAWPADLQAAMRRAVKDAVAWQREQAIVEDRDARKAIEDQGCQISELTPEEHAAFARAVEPLTRDGRATYGEELFGLVRPRAA